MKAFSPCTDARTSALESIYSNVPTTGNTAAAFAPIAWPAAAYKVPKGELAALLDSPALGSLGASGVAVLCALWSYTGHDGIAWPSVDTLARRAHVSRRTAITMVAALERAGLIRRQVPELRARRRRESTTYALPVPPRTLAPPRLVRPATDGSAAVVQVQPPPVDAPPSGATPVVVQVQPLHPKGDQSEGKPEARADAHTPGTATPPRAETDPSPLQAALQAAPVPPQGPQPSRAERAEQNRRAWAERVRPTPPRSVPPRRAPAPIAACVANVPAPPDRDGALAVLRAWRATRQLPLPGLAVGSLALVSRPDRAATPPAPPGAPPAPAERPPAPPVSARPDRPLDALVGAKIETTESEPRHPGATPHSLVRECPPTENDQGSHRRCFAHHMERDA